MSRYLTTHDAEGKAIFSDDLATSRHKLQLSGGTLELLYSSHEAKPNLSAESDISQYAHDRTNGFPGGALSPETGFTAAVVTMSGNAISPMHRTMTLDAVYVVRGDVELTLDSGERRILHTGDSIVQRGTMHQWKNITPNEMELVMVAFAQPTVEPLEVASKKLHTEWLPSTE